MAKRGKSVSNTLVWILLGLLVVGLAGFGTTQYNNQVREIGRVGDASVTVDQYVRAVRQQLNAFQQQTGQPVSFAQAQAFGLDQQIVARLITTAALDNEAMQIGLSVGDETLAQQIAADPGFRGIDGEFSVETYRQRLQDIGYSEQEFEALMRLDTTRTILQAAIQNGNSMPEIYAQTIIGHIGERRDVTWARLTADQLETPVAAPDTTAIKSYYQEHIGRYTRPETRKISYAWITPTMILSSISVDDSDLRKEYEARAAEYNQPERRLVEQIGFADEAAATAARARIEAGEAEFETLVEERGLALGDVDVGDVTQSHLGAAGKEVFAAEIGSVVGPLPSDLGPSLFRVNGVISAQNIAFEDVRDAILDDLATDRARRKIAGLLNHYDDLLAGGATIEEIATETDMVAGQIDWFAGMTDDVAAYEEFSAAAASVTEEDYPELIGLSDGGVFALRLDEAIAPKPEPIDMIRDRVAKDWTDDAEQAALRSQAEALLTRLNAGETFADLGLEAHSETDQRRDGILPGLPPAFLPSAFVASPENAQMLDDVSGVILVRLDAIHAADSEDPDLAGLSNLLGNQLDNGLAREIYQAYADDLRLRGGMSLNQTALDAVNSQLVQ